MSQDGALHERHRCAFDDDLGVRNQLRGFRVVPGSEAEDRARPVEGLGQVREGRDADPAAAVSNEMKTEWPRGSGRWITFPEVDRCAWFTPAEARARINPAQAELVTRLEELLASE